jgi:transglutaminase-like putative cysteine protease
LASSVFARPERNELTDATTRTAAATLAGALVIVLTWLRLEQPRELGPALAAAGLALVPAFVRPWRLRIVAALGVSLGALALAFDASPLWHPGRVLSTFGSGFLDFYDVAVPFDPRVHDAMAGTILVAIFAFCLALGLAVAARRAGAAVVVVLAGAGWPSTLLAGGNELGRGALILLAALVILATMTRRISPAAALPAVAVLALVAVAASSSPAVAKRELVGWQHWDFYTRPDKPVRVDFVWNAQYDGIRWPKKKTVVFTAKAPGRSLYWRAAVLDEYATWRWVQAPVPSTAPGDALLPAAARDRRNLVKAQITIDALDDTHLVGPSEPVRFEAGSAPLLPEAAGVTLLPGGLPRGFTYTAWSYAPSPSPAELARSPADYPRALVAPGGSLDVEPGLATPPFAAPDRSRRLDALLAGNPALQAYQPLVAAARRVAGGAASPYAAAVELESWFRYEGGFRYSNRGYGSAAPPLVTFVAQTRTGYCQFFAGAMALMLRYLGVPARVAVGFVSGTYDSSKHEWTVTDHDAHAWVEVWFRGYGWLPFDPTPGRGRLSAPYSSGSPSFAAHTSSTLAAALGLPDPHDIALQRNLREPGGNARRGRGLGGASRAVAGGGPASAASRTGDLILLVLLVVGAAGVGVAATKVGLRRVRYATRDPRRIASACRRELSEYLLDQRIEAARSATLHELGGLLRAELAVDAEQFVAAASAARFGRPPGARAAAAAARRELRALRRTMRGRLTPYERARGLLSLRSLGVASAP